MKTFSVFALLTLSAVLTAQAANNDPGLGSHSGSQAAADLIRDYAKADGAFLAAGSISPTFDSNNLASLLQFPTDQIVVLTLKGSEIRSAFEKSLEVYPTTNRAFLQVSGFTIEANISAKANSRIVSVNTSSGPLDDSKNYNIAMPLSLGRGGYGYFTIWDKAKVTKTLDGTLESVLNGKKLTETTSRWSLRS